MSDVIYCGQCGNANPTLNKFCGKCGSIIVNPQEKQPDTLPSLTQSSFNSTACPKCNQIDQIQKLTTIVAAGTHTTSGVTTTSGQTNIEGNQKHYAQGTGYVGSSSLSGKAHSSSSTSINITEQSNLAMKLISPSKPQKPTHKKVGFGWWYTLLIFIVGFLVFYGAGRLLIFIEDHLSLRNPPDGLIFIFVLTISSIAGFSVANLLRKYIKKSVIEPRQKQANEKFDAEEKNYKNDMIAWEKATTRWNSMYYCYRDDVVFVPGESNTAAPNQVIELCYKR
jgi:hypothetical protein